MLRNYFCPELLSPDDNYFFNGASAAVFWTAWPKDADASLFFFGVVIKFSFDEQLSLSVAYVDN
jgi:hypothetical protein